MKVLVTFAVEPEFAPWRKLRKFVARTVNGITVYSSEVGGTTVDVVLTGMGAANARRATEAVLSRSYAICISAGFAGALKREYRAGDLLAATSVQHAGGRAVIESNPALVANCLSVGGIRKVPAFLTSETVVDTAQEKVALAEFGDAVEMESFTILSVAEDSDVPAIAIRAISDRFDQKIPMDFSDSVDQCGHILKRRIAEKIVRDPFKIPTLIRLGRQSKAAAEKLSQFLEIYMARLSAEEAPETASHSQKHDPVGAQ